MNTKTKDPPQAPRGRARMNFDSSAAANYLAKSEAEKRAKLARKLAPKKLIKELSKVYPQKKEDK